MAVTLQMDSAIFLFWLQKYEHAKQNIIQLKTPYATYNTSQTR